MFLAQGVEEFPSTDAELCFECSDAVVDSCVDYLAITGTGLRAEGGVAF
jgi:hypothetical protein